jgi:hypothetical protein
VKYIGLDVQYIGLDVKYIGLGVQYLLFLSDFLLKFSFLERFSRKLSNINFHENLSNESRAVPC